mmetsp:Transcript_7490/g.21180  ORF Transcript_7490/g.21180 Transcript_7490/m.21180 type:complete len:159 (+) Transcript_7490:306-782(+)
MAAFSPDNVNREEGTGEPLTETLLTNHPYLYHMVQKDLWEKAKADRTTYFPPTYEQDTFTHATANAQLLIGVANHFYTGIKGDWLCLEMTVDSLKAAGVVTMFEAPAPVGDKAAVDFGGELFPHLYGGIPATPGAVLKEYGVKRDGDGVFVSIEGIRA